MAWQLPLGASVRQAGTRFRVWCPEAQKVEVVLYDEVGTEQAIHLLQPDAQNPGFYETVVERGLAKAGLNYMYQLDGTKRRPDPVSRYQPQGVHGPSQIIDPYAFEWSDRDWQGITAGKVVVYEAHVGTFTKAGTFTAMIEKLDYLAELGVTVLELLPVGDFPGRWGWGYDGVYLYAPANCYGQPDDLRNLINEAHKRGLAVFQDVVYNHLGPDGNYLRDYSKEYFTHKHTTPWGDALNFSCQPVRDFFVNNALFWAHEFHVDGLRLDAVDNIFDDGQPHILAELKQRVQASLPPNRQFLIYAEDSHNDVKKIQNVAEGGYGLDGIWADDYHHQIRVALAHDTHGYYQDYTGSAAEIAATLNQGWLYQGEVSKFWGKSRGGPAGDVSPTHYVHCIQNHDQIGNRALGERLHHAISAAAYRTASSLLLLGPYTPLLFQGQEWSASTPWQFFSDHHDELGKLITAGRRKEFVHLTMFKEGEIPDPQSQKTFERSKLNWAEQTTPTYQEILQLYQDLLKLRSKLLSLDIRQRDHFKAIELSEQLLALHYYKNNKSGESGGASEAPSRELLLVVNLTAEPRGYALTQNPTTTKSEGQWQPIFYSENKRYGGIGEKAFSYEAEQGLLALNRYGAVLLD
jgi:maltooligosyltrehalose trehalohydrolase